MILRALTIGMSFKFKLKTFGDLSVGSNVLKICLLLNNQRV